MTLLENLRTMLEKAVPFQELQERARAYGEACYDQVGSSREMAYSLGDQLRYRGTGGAAGLFGENVATETGGRMTRHALSQLAERLDGPPMRWLGDERHTNEALRADVMNALLLNRPASELLIRHRDDVVRAILSDQYSTFSHVDFLDLVGGALAQVPEIGDDARVHNAQVGDELRAYVLLPRIVFGPDPGHDRLPPGREAPPGGGNGAEPKSQRGDPLHPAFYLSNSEIGTGKVRIHGGLFRVKCANGLIGWEREQGGLDLVHRGLSTRTIASAVADALVEALKLSEELASRFVASQAVLLRPGKIEGLARAWGEKYGLSLPTVDAWYKLVGWEASLNGRTGDEVALFDVVNAATYVAHDLAPAEREQAERMAGDLLYAELPERLYAAAAA